MSSQSTEWWTDDLDDLKDECVRFQLDLSCLVDGELDEAAAGRAVLHLEGCTECSEFFADARRQVEAHRRLADPEALLASCSKLFGGRVEDEVEAIELVGKLSGIFYQLGKAYVLAALNPDHLKFKVFEDVVQVGGFQTKGRGFVDGVIESGRGSTGGVDWREARRMLNGRLEKIESPLEKGRRLLEEALAVDPMHEEARFYLALIDRHEGKTLRAAQSFRRIFQTAMEPSNRVHAAVQLGKLHADQGDHRQAIACYRWVTMSGMADSDPRFYWVRFNIAVNYAHLGDQERSLAAFRCLLDRSPSRVGDIVSLLAGSDSTQQVIARQQGFAAALYDTCPELFGSTASTSPLEEEHQ